MGFFRWLIGVDRPTEALEKEKRARKMQQADRIRACLERKRELAARQLIESLRAMTRDFEDG